MMADVRRAAVLALAEAEAKERAIPRELTIGTLEALKEGLHASNTATRRMMDWIDEIEI